MYSEVKCRRSGRISVSLGGTPRLPIRRASRFGCGSRMPRMENDIRLLSGSTAGKRRAIAEPRSVTLSTGSGAAAQTMAMPPPQSTLPMPHGRIRAGAQAMCPYPCQERSVRPAAALDAAKRSNPACCAYSSQLRSREQRRQPFPRPRRMRLIRSAHTTAALGTLLLASD